MANDEQACYVHIQLPGTMETVPCASLKVRALGAGVFEGTSRTVSAISNGPR